MENATKALLIAGGVLISIIILTIGITLYSIFSNQAKEYNQIISTTEIQKFNSKFDVYVGREDITAQEIVSVVNLAKEHNEVVKIYLQPSYGRKFFEITYETSEEFIEDNGDTTFSCLSMVSSERQNPIYNSETGIITKIIFTQNPSTK